MDSGIYVLQLNKCFQPLEDVVRAFIGNVNTNTPLSTIFTKSRVGVTMYRIAGIYDTSIYPDVVPGGTHNSNAAVVTLINVGGTGVFIFEYDGDMYINHVYDSPGGAQFSGWFKVTTTSV